MKHVLSLMSLAFAVAGPAAFAQKWEVGAGAGGSFLASETISNPAGFGAVLRWDRESGHLKLASGGRRRDSAAT